MKTLEITKVPQKVYDLFANEINDRVYEQQPESYFYDFDGECEYEDREGNLYVLEYTVEANIEHEIGDRFTPGYSTITGVKITNYKFTAYDYDGEEIEYTDFDIKKIKL